MQTSEQIQGGQGPAPILFDEDGFLRDPDQWSRPLGEQIAAQEGVGPLGRLHWLVIHMVRSKYYALGAVPQMRRVCRESGLDRDEIAALFGSCRTIWRIAGLPHPGSEALAHAH